MGDSTSSTLTDKTDRIAVHTFADKNTCRMESNISRHANGPAGVLYLLSKDWQNL
jgi:hypothetical protein